jgi:hypothetical protein
MAGREAGRSIHWYHAGGSCSVVSMTGRTGNDERDPGPRWHQLHARTRPLTIR